MEDSALVGMEVIQNHHDFFKTTLANDLQMTCNQLGIDFQLPKIPKMSTIVVFCQTSTCSPLLTAVTDDSERMIVASNSAAP